MEMKLPANLLMGAKHQT